MLLLVVQSAAFREAKGATFLQRNNCPYKEQINKKFREFKNVFAPVSRRLYLLVTYLGLFFDVIYSMAMSILRILSSFIFSCVMVFRLDRDLFMRGLEGWDLGKVGEPLLKGLGEPLLKGGGWKLGTTLLEGAKGLGFGEPLLEGVGFG